MTYNLMLYDIICLEMKNRQADSGKFDNTTFAMTHTHLHSSRIYPLPNIDDKKAAKIFKNVI